MMGNIKLGVIADDFTGASDAASFLVEAGYRVILLTDVRGVQPLDCDCVVVAQKIRSVPPKEAIRQVQAALGLFRALGVEKVYYKYCSTFDSTPKGNIGIIGDYLMEALDVPYTLLCPSLPVNGRTVKDGRLYVNGQPLDESPMRNHPLNPMWDSYIPNLMKEQSGYPCYVLDRETLKQPSKGVNEAQKTGKFYLVPDYETEEDGRAILAAFPDLRLYTGGSGLLEYFGGAGGRGETVYKSEGDSEKAVILCGSCSEMSGRQIRSYIEKGHPFVRIDSEKLLAGEVNAEQIFETVLQNLPETTVVYSDGVEKNMSGVARDETFTKLSTLFEKLLADLSEKTLQAGFGKIVVAGGETSGAVTLRLNYHAYHIGRVIAPGVPMLIPVENPKLQLALKSGNFGDEEFFTKSLSEEK